ncbi:MAG: nucleoside triphosphate pyrophosphatase [Rhodothermia bacterium]
MKDSLILASSSPRRQALLERLGVKFEIVVDHVDETVGAGLSPAETVCVLAERKAKSVSMRNPDRLVLAADTIVVLDDAILGKPASRSQALRMLAGLSGRTHEVLTGVAFLHLESGRKVVDYEVTEVTFSPLTQDEIEVYVSGGSPMDKAGAYGIQDDRGSLFIRRIAGDYYNVVGLPLNLIYRLARQHFPELTLF